MSEKITHQDATGLVLKDSGARQDFSTGANRDVSEGKGRFDLLPPWAIEMLAKLYEAGCRKYGDRNWEKGIPLSNYFSSGLRHAFKYLRGDRDEDHLLAAAWNFMCALDTRERIKLGMLPETLNNLPTPKPTEDIRQPEKAPPVQYLASIPSEYRVLKPGEIIEPTDQCWDGSQQAWVRSLLAGCEVIPGLTYIRRHG